MSWFTEIAGRAEDLLNKVDKSAATALQKKAKFSSAVDINTDLQNIEHLPSAFIASSSETLSSGLSSHSGDSNKFYKRAYSTSKVKPKSDDEKLLLFLNSSEHIPNIPAKQMPVKKSHSQNVEDQKPISSDKLEVKDAKISENRSHVQPSTDAEGNMDTHVVELCVPACESRNVDEKNSSSTVVSQEELLLYKKQAEHAEYEKKRMQKKLEHWNSQISGNDKLMRDLHDRESDLIAALDAKDSQLAVLKVRLEEADNEIQNKKMIVEELKAENERLQKNQEDDSLIHNQTVDNLREKLSQAESELCKYRDTYHLAQTEHLLQMSKMEEEQRSLAENVTNLQRKWSEQNEKNKDLKSQLQVANRNLDSLQQEYADYKQKAQRILQSKEKLIISLKEGNQCSEEQLSTENSFAVLSAETEGIKQERDLLREELRRANETIEICRNEIQELEKMAQTDADTAREHYKNLEEQLHQERVLKEEVQLLNNQMKEEIQFLRDDLSRVQNNLQSRIQDREMEIEKIRKQLTTKSLSTVSQDELESRLHALTENLIQKQTIVEALSTEKNSLVLQLERLEQQFKEAQMYGSQNHTVVGVNHPEAERKQKPPLFLENPFDSHLTRRVKRVYGSIDAFSIRMGIFFRRYPIARMFIIVYMLILHLWVMIVLLTYEPEVHTKM